MERRISMKINFHDRLCRSTIVSFDIFGTLVLRDVAKPEDVFKVVERICNNAIPNFADFRLKAYADSIEKIYEQIQQHTGCSDKIKDQYRKCEEDCEIGLSIPDKEMVHLLHQLRESGKYIILTSDMYLNEFTIERILSHCGIEKGRDYERLFLSSKFGCSKKSGRLFQMILKEYEIKPEQLIHIGDAIRSDYLIPKKMGIRTVYYSKVDWTSYLLNKICSNSDWERKALLRFSSNHIQNMQYYEKFGYQYLGPLLYGFIKWVKEQTEDYRGTIYFLAREGKIFKEVYELIGGKNDTEYVRVSRHSIIGALLWTYKDVADVIKMFIEHDIMRKVKMETLISYLNISKIVEKDTQWDSLKNKNFFKIQDILNDFTVMNFLAKYENDIKEVSKEQYNLLTDYLKKIGLNNQFPIVIVDIGWKGTMQDWLSKFWQMHGINKPITGLYLGMRKGSSAIEKKGYLFDGEIGIRQSDIFSFGGLLESLLSETKGSVRCYEKYLADTYTVYSDYEYSNMDQQKVVHIQHGGINYVKEMKNSPLARAVTFRPKDVAERIIHVGNFPSRNDLMQIGSMSFKDITYGCSMIADNTEGSIKEQIMSCNWKVGYLKKVFGNWFPAGLVYRIVYNYMRKEKE